MIRLAIPLFLSLTLSYASFESPDQRIVPAVRIGSILIGDSQKDVHRKLGKPVRSFTTHGSRAADLWQFGSVAEEIEVVYRNRRVVQIKTSIETFKTAQGVSTASVLSTIKRLHPRLESTIYLLDNESGNGLEYHDDVRGGITFVVPVPWKESAKPEKPWLILVHPAGQRAIPTDIKDPTNRATVEKSEPRRETRFTGDWHSTTAGSSFHLWLIQDRSFVSGSHDIVTRQGSRIDAPSRREGEDDTTITGKVTGKNVAVVTFQSARDENSHGTARLRRVGDTLRWEVISPGQGDHLFPASATLRRNPLGKRGPISQDYLIDPGVGIGQVTLGLTSRRETHAKLGKPTSSRLRKDGLREDTWEAGKTPEFPHPPYRLTILFRRARAEQIEVSHPIFKTRDGLSTSTRFGDIVKRLPHLKVSQYGYDEKNACGLYYDDVAKGLTFFVVASDEVHPQFKPESVIVHRPGVPVIRLPGGVRYNPPDLDKTGVGKGR